MTATITNYEEKPPHWHLVQQILKRSKADTWALAVKEWKLTAIKRSDIPHKCLCTHYPIKELCYLYNTKTNETVIVGNCCVRLFQGAPITLDSVFHALTRGRLNKALIEYAYDNGILSDWEYNFSCDTWRKRVLTWKQQSKRSCETKRINCSGKA
jgi:hypothetical protein